MFVIKKENKNMEFFRKKQLVTVSSMFETLPVWLLCTCNVKVKEIYIPQETYFSLLSNLIKDKNIDTSLFEKLITHIGRQSFFFEKKIL